MFFEMGTSGKKSPVPSCLSRIDSKKLDWIGVNWSELDWIGLKKIKKGVGIA